MAGVAELGRRRRSPSPSRCSGVVWIISSVAQPDPTPLSIPGITEAPERGQRAPDPVRQLARPGAPRVRLRRGLHRRSSLPLSAERRTGASRWIHEKARPVAFAWVIAVTCFSLATQAYALGLTGATLAYQLQIPTGALMLTVLPHALWSSPPSSCRWRRGRSPAARESGGSARGHGGDRRRRDPHARARGPLGDLRLAADPRGACRRSPRAASAGAKPLRRSPWAR